mgnify:CR=1 FL=1
MEKRKVNVERFDNNLLIGEADIITDSTSDTIESSNEACKEIEEQLPKNLNHLEVKVDKKSIQEIRINQSTEKKVNFTFELFSKEHQDNESKTGKKDIYMTDN